MDSKTTDTPASAATTAAQAISAFSAQLRPSDLTAAVRHLVARTLVDTVAVGIAGVNEPASTATQRYLEQLGEPGSIGATLWGTNRKSLPEGAALFNGIAGHVLDYDDVATPLQGHPSVVLWPALLAVGEAFDVPGERLISGYVVGFEVLCRLGKAVSPGHYHRGWHATATIGAIAATAGCAHLLGLTEEQTINALGIAVAETAGTRANFGSDAKSFQAGQGNASAVRAVLLAREGFTASPDALDSKIGFAGLYGEGQDLYAFFSDCGTAPLALEAHGVDVKKFPLCFGTHRTVAAVLQLRKAHNLRLEDVESVKVNITRMQLTPLIHHRPQTGLQGKFSIEHAVAAALLDGDLTLATFTDAAVQRKALQAFFPKVHATGDLAGPTRSEVEIRLKNGAAFTTNVSTVPGSAQLPLSDEELQVKVADCLAAARSPCDAPTLMKAAAELDRMTTREFAALLRAA